MRQILVIRFGALGDLCVLGWALASLAERSPDDPCRVTVVTKAAFAPLVLEFQGVAEVAPLADNSWRGVKELAGQLRSKQWDVVLDAHNTIRSKLLLARLGRRPAATLAKDTLRRLWFMYTGRGQQGLQKSMCDRFLDLTAVAAPNGPAALVRPPLERYRTLAAESSPAGKPIIGLAPGAQWNTKRWPVEHYTELLGQLAVAGDLRLRIYLGPRENSWYRSSPLAAMVARTAGATVVRHSDLTAVARDLAELDLLVTNDSGLLHLAEAAGTRVLGFFGPTVREFGYFPLLPTSRVLERPLDCRPCSRNGKRPCHRGDLACLNGITPDQACATIQSMLAEVPA